MVFISEELKFSAHNNLILFANEPMLPFCFSLTKTWIVLREIFIALHILFASCLKKNSIS